MARLLNKRKNRGPGSSTRRALAWLAFLPLASRAPVYTRLMWALVRDERTPAGRKALLGGALGYLLMGRDVIPDDVPIVGRLDDLVVVVLAVDLFLEGIPGDLLREKLDELGIDRSAFEHDVAQIRRLTPGPVRRAIRRLPAAASAAQKAVQATGLGTRFRSWIDKEGSIA